MTFKAEQKMLRAGKLHRALRYLAHQASPLALRGGDEMSKCFLPYRDGKGMTSSNS